SYHLAPFGEQNASMTAAPLFSGIDLTRNTALHHLITSLKEPQLDPAQIATELETFFEKEKGFTYSDQDASALNSTTSLTERIQHFLEHGKGVCYEFATAYAAVLEQEFSIATRLCDGHVSKDDTIPREAHRWVQYSDAQGNWHLVDPTPASAFDARRNASRITTPADFHPKSRPHTEDELKYFSLHELGLIYWPIQREGQAFNAVRGVLDVKRLLAGETKIFRDPAALSTSQQTRALYIANFPSLTDGTSCYRDFMLITSPLQALLDHAVPVFTANKEGGFKQLHDMSQIMKSEQPDDVVPRPRAGDDDKKLVDLNSDPFLTKLVSHYYESRLTLNNISRDDTTAVKNCLFQIWDDLGYLRGQNILPVQLTLDGKVWELTQHDLALFQMSDEQSKMNQENYENLIQCLHSHANTIYAFEEQSKLKKLIHKVHFTPVQNFLVVALLVDALNIKENRIFAYEQLSALPLEIGIETVDADDMAYVIAYLVKNLAALSMKAFENATDVVLRVLGKIQDKSFEFNDKQVSEIENAMNILLNEGKSLNKLENELVRVVGNFRSNEIADT
ncbi:MAG: transglutaminase-like domain-containing protein, partial [Burkholderiaceae bacterium]